MKRAFLILPVCLLGFAFVAAGCSDEDNRQPTKAEGAAADTKRLSYIDSMPNLSAEQKAKMKAQMGGPPAPNPADAAREKAAGGGQPSGRRN